MNMDSKNIESILRSIKKAGIKTAGALKDYLKNSDLAAESSSDTLSARGRLTSLFDEGTFVETGAFVHRRRDEFDEASPNEFEGVITGYGAVDGRLVFAFSQDYARTKGALSEAHAKKISETYRLAVENGAPVIGVFDSAGAYLPEGVGALAGYGSVMKCVSDASGVIPQIAVVAGTCVGASAVIAAMFDFVIVASDHAELSVASPFNIGDGVTGVGGNAAKSGLASLACDNAVECIAAARRLASYLPMNNAEGTVMEMSGDDANRESDISAYTATGDTVSLIKGFTDLGEYLELYAGYAPEMNVGFASLGGTVVGIVANNKAGGKSTFTANAARKASRIVSFCDSFSIPLITVVDCTGLDVSKEAESLPYASELARLASLYSSAKNPLVTLIAGEAYGTVFAMFGSKAVGADTVLALDTAKIAAMNASSAVAFLWNDQISESVSREELEDKWNETCATPVKAACAGEIDDIIDGTEVRARLAAAVNMLSSKSASAPSRRHSNMPL